MYTVYVCFYNLGKAKMIPKMLLIPSAFLTRLAKKWNSKAGSNWRSSFEVTQFVATKCKNLRWFFACPSNANFILCHAEINCYHPVY